MFCLEGNIFVSTLWEEEDHNLRSVFAAITLFPLSPPPPSWIYSENAANSKNTKKQSCYFRDDWTEYPVGLQRETMALQAAYAVCGVILGLEVVVILALSFYLCRGKPSEGKLKL